MTKTSALIPFLLASNVLFAGTDNCTVQPELKEGAFPPVSELRIGKPVNLSLGPEVYGCFPLMKGERKLAYFWTLYSYGQEAWGKLCKFSEEPKQYEVDVNDPNQKISAEVDQSFSRITYRKDSQKIELKPMSMPGIGWTSTHAFCKTKIAYWGLNDGVGKQWHTNNYDLSKQALLVDRVANKDLGISPDDEYPPNPEWKDDGKRVLSRPYRLRRAPRVKASFSTI